MSASELFPSGFLDGILSEEFCLHGYNTVQSVEIIRRFGGTCHLDFRG
jgi:hypothetical protein